MSKSDEIRALREARYERARANAAGRQNNERAKLPEVVTKAAPPEKAGSPAPQPTEPKSSATNHEPLCGHRSISGRTCTREHGHAAKSHRYS